MTIHRRAVFPERYTKHFISMQANEICAFANYVFTTASRSDDIIFAIGKLGVNGFSSSLSL